VSIAYKDDVVTNCSLFAFVIAMTHPQPPTVTNSRAWSLALLIVGIAVGTVCAQW
jgi:hypothetical protein